MPPGLKASGCHPCAGAGLLGLWVEPFPMDLDRAGRGNACGPLSRPFAQAEGTAFNLGWMFP